MAEPLISPYIIAIALGWIIAQGSKYLFSYLKTRQIGSLRQLYTSGNMPSAHSASVTALTTLVGLREGFSSGLFAVALLLALIVMYDAVMVRRSSGEQGLAIQELIKLGKSQIVAPRAAKGHTPLEVLVGMLIGIAIGAVVFLATK